MDATNMGLPLKAHIPRPENDNEVMNVELNPKAAVKWGRDFDKAVGNIQLSSTDKSAIVESLLKAKTEIENTLSIIGTLSDERKEVEYVDLPFPVVDHTRKDFPDVLDAPKSNSGNEKPLTTVDKTIEPGKKADSSSFSWSEERHELLQTVHNTNAEIGKQFEVISCLEQENKELKELINVLRKQLETAKEEEKTTKTKLDFCLTSLKEIFLYSEKESKNEVKNESLWTFNSKKNKECSIYMVSNKSKGLDYIGKMKDNRKEGYGILFNAGSADKKKMERNKSFIRYEGTWLNDMMHGYGILRDEEATYKGEFKEGYKEGHGSLSITSGDFYKGNWSGGKLNGYATAEFPEGGKYEGFWVDGAYEGAGKLTGTDFTFYEGDFKEGLEEGRGVWSTEDGMTYDGEWREGKKHGKGTFTHTEGWTYTGDWVNGKKEGHGEMTYLKSTYKGEWKDDCRQGEGVYVFSNGDIYSGMWGSNVADGKGRYTFSDGAVYEGLFVKGWPNGEGDFTFPSGAKVSREWREHLPTGYRVEMPWQKTMHR